MGGVNGWGARVSDFFHTESKSKNLKKKYFFGGGAELGAGWVGVCGGGEGGRWMDRRTGPNQFALSTFSKLGA